MHEGKQRSWPDAEYQCEPDGEHEAELHPGGKLDRPPDGCARLGRVSHCHFHSDGSLGRRG